MHLYLTNITPAESDVLATYSANEVSDPGYTAATLTGALWTVATVLGVTTATYAQEMFTMDNSASVYGYYVTDNSSTNLLWSERFNAAPFNIPAGGGRIAIDPAIELA